MVDYSKLKGLIISKGYTIKQVYEYAGLTRRQWSTRAKKGNWGSEEMQKIYELLGDDVIPIFFEPKVTQQVTYDGVE